MAQAAILRMTKEVRMMQADPPPGVWAAPVGDTVTELEAQIQGPKDTVYEGGVFKLAVDIPARYPFEPPKVRFETPVYHPNIDPEGRICLDILNMPPKGAWKPSLNVSTVLASIGLLLAAPNADDGLVTDVTAEFKHQRQMFDAKARQWTQRHAVQAGGTTAAPAQAPPGGTTDNILQYGVAAQQRQDQQQQRQHDELRTVGSGRRADAVPAAAAHSDENGGCAVQQQQQQPTTQQAKASPGGSSAAATQQPAAQQAAKRPRLGLRS